MTFLEAALTVLRNAKTPLTTVEVAQRAMDGDLLSTKGKTPEASMSAALYREAGAASPRVKKLAEPGATPAKRGSVRWTSVAASHVSTSTPAR